MKHRVCLELRDSDFKGERLLSSAKEAMAVAEVVIYRGEVVKNRTGFITRTLDEVRKAKV